MVEGPFGILGVLAFAVLAAVVGTIRAESASSTGSEAEHRAAAEREAEADRMVPVYIGTYTTRGSQGIYLTHLDLETGRLTEPVLAAETTNPSFLAIHPNGRWLYA